MFKNLFVKTSSRTIYRGTKESASVEREMYSLPTEREARIIDKQEAEIRNLEKEAKNDMMLRFYMYGY